MGKSEENLIFSDEEDCPDVSITNLYVFKSIISLWNCSSYSAILV